MAAVLAGCRKAGGANKYGGANKPLLRKMVGNVFERQPKYQDDLRTCIQSMLKVGAS